MIRGNCVYRNLEEQVRKNQSDIQDITSATGLLGIKSVGVVPTYEDLPAEDSEEFEALEYGDAYAVGESAPYTFYVKTRANDSITYDHWFLLGSIQGAQGPQGEPGTNGTNGVSPRLRINPQTGYWEVDYIIGGVGWQSLGVLAQGPQGETGQNGQDGAPGEQGPKGDPGGWIHIVARLARVDMLPDPEESEFGDAYLVGTVMPQDLYILVGQTLADAVWTNIGPLNVGTFVKSGGQFTNEWDADTKVDKRTTVTTLPQAYIKLGNGGQSYIDLDPGANGNSLAVRTNGGQVRVGNPQGNDDAANKAYVDAQKITIVYHDEVTP